MANDSNAKHPENTNPTTLNQTKISGYLEKKGKLRMVSSWKRYWFVLEGRLLLYYRSRSEYETLSPCKGSVTLGTSCNIKPTLASNGVFQIETRINTVTLRAENRYEQDRWMQAILSALNQTGSSNPAAKLSHFRYSADDLVRHQEVAADKESENKTKTSKLKNKTEEAREQEVFEENNKADDGKEDVSSNTIIDEGNNVDNEDKKSHIYQEIDSLVHVGPIEEETSNCRHNSSDSDQIQMSPENLGISDTDKNGSEMELELSELKSESESKSASELESQAESVRETKAESSSEPKSGSESKKGSEADSTSRIESQLSTGSETKSETKSESEVKTESEVKSESNEESDINLESESKLVSTPKQDPEPILKGVPKTENKIEPSIKTDKDFRIKKLAKIVKDTRLNNSNISSNSNGKENGKRRSFVSRVFNKIRGQEPSTPPNTPQICNEIKDTRKSYQNEFLKTFNDEKKYQKLEYSFKTYEPEEVIDEDEPPELPLKRKYQKYTKYEYDLYNLENRLAIPRPKLIIAKSMKQATPVNAPLANKANEENESDKLQTINEILDGLESIKPSGPKLDAQHQSSSDLMDESRLNSRQNVRKLIEKFNDPEKCANEQDEVRLRRPKCEVSRENNNSNKDDLNFLLEKLTEVTNAPIMPPGVTTSLVDTPPECEWKFSTHERKRRFSEPDYDIPRPHSALQIIPSEEETRDMVPTRFLGPVIMDHNGNTTSCTTSCATSMTPDSLEMCYNYNRVSPGLPEKYTSPLLEEEDRSIGSYTSHVYRLVPKISVDYVAKRDVDLSEHRVIKKGLLGLQDSLEMSSS